MREFTRRRSQNTPDEIWLLEHYPVFTQGVGGKPEHILNVKGIPVIQTDRGGQVTYHGPGQLICYILFDLRRLKLGIKNFVNLLENTVIQALGEYGIHGEVKKDAPGVYVKDQKICSLGLKISRGCSYHGIALNIENDLEPFTRINPCGHHGLSMIKMNNFVQVTLDEVGKKFCQKFTASSLL